MLSVSDFVALLNQTLEYAYPSVVIVGELANFRVSKNRWVYFDLKDEHSSVKFFGTIYGLPGPLEDGMMLQVRGTPRLHQLYGFSVTYQTIQPVGEGSLKRAAALLEAKLAAEGLFDPARKRPLPYPPKRIGLIASRESAAYHDFVKILNERWGGVEILLADVQVQGEASPRQIVAALEYFNTAPEIDVVVITRGGGSPEDLAAFSTEQVTRAVAASRTPTIVAIGHEVDISLAELAADQRASTPSNAAQLLVPDKRHVLEQLLLTKQQLNQLLTGKVQNEVRRLGEARNDMTTMWDQYFRRLESSLKLKSQLIEAFNPESALKRGYAIVRRANEIIRSGKQLKVGDDLSIQLSDGRIDTTVNKIGLE
ncbi:MAG: Exodeoxyribonuclease 7 large subunit [Candidatus Saccharibacteria bacterium]|nr:Exodeoxyribonuclease 7 large subunit [Candidatus Saccharibacteria bacterium]